MTLGNTDPPAIDLWQQADGVQIRRLFLRDLILNCRIGIHDFERDGPQRVRINVDLYVQLPAVLNDEIAAVLDYDFLRHGITRLVADRHFNLQETLLNDILQLCLEPPAVLAARVRTEKLDVYPDCAGVGVEGVRMKTIQGTVR